MAIFQPYWSDWELKVNEVDGSIFRRAANLWSPIPFTVDERGFHYVSIQCSAVYLKETARITDFKKIHVAQIVLLACGDPRPSMLHQACHRNDNPSDNRLANLYWGNDFDQARDRTTNRSAMHRPKAMYINPWVVVALRQFFKSGPLRPHLPAKPSYLAENLLRQFLDEEWPEWLSWAKQKIADSNTI